MLKIWGRANSVNVQKVLWFCEELNVEYERIDAGGPFGVVDTTEYRRRNPNGLVPTIDDDGFILWESNAIVRYLAAKLQSNLWPALPRMRAEADQWMDWSHTLWAALRPVFLGLIRTPPEKRNEAVDVLFDQLITFQLEPLKAATKSLHELDAGATAPFSPSPRSMCSGVQLTSLFATRSTRFHRFSWPRHDS